MVEAWRKIFTTIILPYSPIQHSVVISSWTKQEDTNTLILKEVQLIWSSHYSTITSNWIIASFGPRLFGTSWSLFQVLLMILFCSVKLLRWQDLYHDLFMQWPLVPFHWFPCSSFLISWIVIYARSVLSAFIIALQIYAHSADNSCIWCNFYTSTRYKCLYSFCLLWLWNRKTTSGSNHIFYNPPCTLIAGSNYIFYTPLCTPIASMLTSHWNEKYMVDTLPNTWIWFSG